MSLSTIRRRHDDGTFTQAYKGPDGEWRIPVEDLISAGFVINRPSTDQPDRAGSPDTSRGHDHPDIPGMTEVRAWFEARIAETEQRAAVAEARLDEKDRTIAAYAQDAEDLRTSLRMLDSGPPTSRYELDEETRENEQQPGWWQRLRRRR